MGKKIVYKAEAHGNYGSNSTVYRPVYLKPKKTLIERLREARAKINESQKNN